MTGGGGVGLAGGGADQGAVQVQLDLGGVGVDPDGSLAAGDILVVGIPCGDQVDSGLSLVPLGTVQVEGVLGKAGGLDDAEVGAVGDGAAAGVAGAGAVPGSGLTDVVETGPDKLTGDAVVLVSIVDGIVGGDAPADCGGIVGGQVILAVGIGVVVLVLVLAAGVGVGSGLRGDDDAVVAAEAVGQVVQGGSGVGVVEACDAACIGNGVDDIDQGLVAAAVVITAGDDAGAVLVIDPGDVVGADVIVTGNVVPVGALLDLVAEGPGDDTGSVLVTLDHGTGNVLGIGHAGLEAVQAGAGGLLEVLGEVVGVAVLGIDQTVEGLLDDQQAQLVTDLDVLLISGVVGGTDGVCAHVLHDGQLTVHGVVVSGGAQTALVMVHADAVELDSLAVQVEAGGLPLGPAEAEGLGGGVDHVAVHQDLGGDGVQVGVLDGPQGGSGHGGLQLGNGGAVGGDGDGGLGGGAVGDGGADGDISAGDAVVDQIDLHSSGAHAGSDVGGGDGDAVQVHMDALQGVQLHITVDAGAGVPTGGGDIVDGLDGDNVLGSAIADQVVRNVESEGGVAIVMLTDENAVDIHIGVGVDTVKVQQERLTGRLLADGKALAVPAGAAGQEAGLGFAAGGEVLGDGEVMGQIHIVPCGVVEVLLGGGGVVAQVELPAHVKVVDSLGCGVGAELDLLSAAHQGVFCRESMDREHGDHHDQCHNQRKQTVGAKGVLHIITSFCQSAKNADTTGCPW